MRQLELEMKDVLSWVAPAPERFLSPWSYRTHDGTYKMQMRKGLRYKQGTCAAGLQPKFCSSPGGFLV